MGIPPGLPARSFDASVADTAVAAAASSTLIERFARSLLQSRLAQLREGELQLVDHGQVRRFGQADSGSPLRARIDVLHPQFYPLTAFGGTVGAGEAYIRGYWRCDRLTELVRMFVRNRAVLNDLDGGWTWLQQSLLRALHFANRNTRYGSARNIAAHYDLGNDFYRLMLDETMAYSCGLFTSERATLAEASRAKFDAACRKLDLQPGEHLLEIGTGWGGLALHAAQHYGCHVTSTTISQAQYHYTQALVRQLGLGDRITLLLRDYRELDGRYDKLVSIEMIEAVGAAYLDTYFRKCAALLKDTGAMLLQAITIQDQLYRRALRSVDYIQRFVFPGSFIPSVSAIADSLRRVTDLKLFHLEDIGPHYARTLAAWRDNLLCHGAEVRRLGHSEDFVRLWDFYLCYCEGGFAERALGDVQMLLTKPRSRRPPISALA